MNGHWLLSLVLAAVAAGANAANEGTVDDQHVIVLTSANFDDILKDNSIVLIKFYAPWCGHCKRMAPDYAKAAKMLKDAGSKVVIAKVDAVAETELANKHDIQEFPTITLFRNTVPEPFTGSRTAEGIVEWISKMTGPAVIEFEGEGMETLVTRDSPIAFVGEFKARDSDMGKMFEKVANESRQLGQFVYRKANVDKIYTLRHEEGATEFEGKTEEELRNHIKTESFPLLGPINTENFRKYIESERSLAWYCGTEEEFNSHKAAIRSVAKEFREDYSFVWLDTANFKGHAESALGLSEFPGLVIQTRKGRYVLPEPSSCLKDSKKTAQFCKDVKEGKIERSLKSDPVPEKNDEPVKVIVGKTFESMVIQSDKDVFLEVYAPWCGYCKSFEPIYSDFAEKVQTAEHVLVAKMDGTTNEAPFDDFEWNSFPTIFFVKSGTNTPMKFEGSRTADGLMEFLEKHSSKPIVKKSVPTDEL